MDPDNRLRSAALAVEVVQQGVERLGHVAVAQVPGRDPAVERRAVTFLGVLHQPRVLLGVEEVVLRHAPVAARVLSRAPVQLDELADDLLLAGLGQSEARSSKSRTSSSVVCEKSWYQRPTA